MGQPSLASQARIASSLETSGSRRPLNFSANPRFSNVAHLGFGTQALRGPQSGFNQIAGGTEYLRPHATARAATPTFGTRFTSVVRQNVQIPDAIAALRPARNFTSAMVPHNFFRTDANDAINERINPAAAVFPRNFGNLGRKGIEYHTNMIPLLEMHPRNLVGHLLRPRRFQNVTQLGYVIIGDIN